MTQPNRFQGDPPADIPAVPPFSHQRDCDLANLALLRVVVNVLNGIASGDLWGNDERAQLGVCLDEVVELAETIRERMTRQADEADPESGAGASGE